MGTSSNLGTVHRDSVTIAHSAAPALRPHLSAGPCQAMALRPYMQLLRLV
jgi:hypothetical protein